MTRSDRSAESFGEKVQRLQSDLTARGEHLSFAAPPAWRLAWRVGWNWTPPLFVHFWTNALTMGSAWALLWLIGWMSLPYLSGPLDGIAFASASISAACFGLAMAGMARHQHKRLRLPAWRDY